MSEFEAKARRNYQIPDSLNCFQRGMYIHLIDKKIAAGVEEPGFYNFKDNAVFNDAIVPPEYQNLEMTPNLYKPALPLLLSHRNNERINNPFKIHMHFYHMASSQAANINLFLPLLVSSKVNEVFMAVKPDFKSLIANKLDRGFCIEYWGENFGKDKNSKGLLADHNARSGTDSDIAIAYLNKNDEPCLWLIEHKLTEKEFTTCGGFRSKGRTKSHDCLKNFDEILKNNNLCYYHDKRYYKYWEVTRKHREIFQNYEDFEGCPFIYGMNQLWRNHLLALAIEDSGEFKHVYFSVVHHPGNEYLQNSIEDYKKLTNNNLQFSVLTSDLFVNAAEKVADKELKDWINWYRDFYKI